MHLSKMEKQFQTVTLASVKLMNEKKEELGEIQKQKPVDLITKDQKTRCEWQTH